MEHETNIQRLFASPGGFMMPGAGRICTFPAGFAETVWGSMASGGPVVLDKWGGTESGA